MIYLINSNVPAYFSKIYLRSGYNPLRVRGVDIPQKKIRTRYGHYDFLVMFFRLKNALAIFMYQINRMLRDYLDFFFIVFIENTLVYSKNESDHMGHLRVVLQVLKEHQLFAKYRKCEFWLWPMAFLGYIMLLRV